MGEGYGALALAFAVLLAVGFDVSATFTLISLFEKAETVTAPVSLALYVLFLHLAFVHSHAADVYRKEVFSFYQGLVMALVARFFLVGSIFLVICSLLYLFLVYRMIKSAKYPYDRAYEEAVVRGSGAFRWLIPGLRVPGSV